jgi:TRAP-type C4-dicarboxylate transport system permease small subunit
MKRSLSAIANIITHISNFSAWLSVLCVFMLAAVIAVSVFSRYLFNKPILGVDEISGYLNVLIGFLALAYTLYHDRHVRVDIVTKRLPPKFRNVLEIVTTALTLLLIAAFIRTSWYTWMILINGDERAQTYLRTPLAIPYGFMHLGWALLFLMLLVHFVRVSSGMWKSNKGNHPQRDANNKSERFEKLG